LPSLRSRLAVGRNWSTVEALAKGRWKKPFFVYEGATSTKKRRPRTLPRKKTPKQGSSYLQVLILKRRMPSATGLAYNTISLFHHFFAALFHVSLNSDLFFFMAVFDGIFANLLVCQLTFYLSSHNFT